jgi:hypothetical protein
MVSVFVIGPKVCRFKPGSGDGFLTAIKICSTPSRGGEVKLEAPCHKILQHVKCHLRVWTKILHKAKILIRFAHSSWLLPDDSAGSFARELWWTNQEFSSNSVVIPPWLSMSPGGRTTGPLVVAVQRHSFTPSSSCGQTYLQNGSKDVTNYYFHLI